MKFLQRQSSRSAVLAALLLVAVACGSSDSDGATTTAVNGTVAGIDIFVVICPFLYVCFAHGASSLFFHSVQ
jgi:hypothetical protein